MIPLNLEDDVVLRRALEELEASIPYIEVPPTVTRLETGATLEEVVTKVNELVGTLGLVLTALKKA